MWKVSVVGVVVLPHVGRVTLGTHVIPVLLRARPVERIRVRDPLVRVEMEPALAARLLRPRVPRERESLDAAVRELDQVLLQRLDAEGISHGESGRFPVLAVGLDDETPALAEEARP